MTWPLANGDYEFIEGFKVLGDMMEPYPWWYWFLLLVLNTPVYIGLIYVVFFSREGFKANWDAVVTSVLDRLAAYHPANLFAFFRFLFWLGLCALALIVEHHMLWKGLFSYE